jgi:hypothetical protein
MVHIETTALLERQRSDDADVHTVASCEVPPPPTITLRSAVPRLDPRTVTLDAPVAAELTPSPLLTDTASCVNAFVEDRRRTLAVTLHARPRPPLLLDSLQSTDDSDDHRVSSHPLPPTRARTLTSRTPAALPSTVTLKPPVDTVLARTAAVTLPASTVNAIVTLDRSAPEDAVTDSNVAPPLPPLQASDDEDTHAVASLPLLSTPPRPLLENNSNPRPSTVTLADPVAAVFEGPARLTRAPSYDIVADIVTPAADALTPTAKQPSAPATDLLCTHVADTQPLASLPDTPTRTRALTELVPIPDPSNVTLAAPVPPMFTAAAPLAKPTSNENTPARDPDAASSVNIAHCPAPSPLAAFTTKDVDDDQADDSLPLAPSRPAML